jgi:hypothetical protein
MNQHSNYYQSNNNQNNSQQFNEADGDTGYEEDLGKYVITEYSIYKQENIFSSQLLIVGVYQRKIIILLQLDERESGSRQRSMSNDSSRRNHTYSTHNNNNTSGQLNQLPPQVQQYFGSSEELPGTSG